MHRVTGNPTFFRSETKNPTRGFFSRPDPKPDFRKKENFIKLETKNDKIIKSEKSYSKF